MSKAYVLDTTALFIGLEIEPVMFTTPEVIDEVIREEEKIKLETLKGTRLKVKRPPKEFLEKAKHLANKIGEIRKLTSADLSLLALALYLKESGFETYLVTEDYALQNVATFAGLQILTVRGRKISDHIIWEFYCPGCRRKVNSLVKICPICGTTIKRRPKRELRA